MLLLHGENTVMSRKELLDLKQKYGDAEIISYEGKSMSLTDFVQATQATSLFGTKRLVIIENILSKRFTKKSADLEQFVELLPQVAQATEIVFWEEKNISKTLLQQFPKNLDVALFKPNRMLFAFVESVRPGNQREALDSFSESLKRDAVELIFTMLVRQFRYLVMVKDLGKRIPELSSWQVAKFAKQAEFFTLERLLALYQQLFEIDVTIKTGNSPFTLEQQIRLFIISL